MKKRKLAALAAALAALGPSKRHDTTRPPRKFTDARKAAAEAKRQRKAAKRLAAWNRQQGGLDHE